MTRFPSFTPAGAYLHVYPWGRLFNVVDIDRISVGTDWPAPAAKELGRLGENLAWLALWRRNGHPAVFMSSFGVIGALHAPALVTDQLVDVMVSAEYGDATLVSPIADLAEAAYADIKAEPTKQRRTIRARHVVDACTLAIEQLVKS